MVELTSQKFIDSSALFHRFEQTPRPARHPSLRTTRFRHGYYIWHYSVVSRLYSTVQDCFLLRSTQHHPRSFSSSTLNLSTTFFLRKSLSPNLRKLASPHTTHRMKLTSPLSSQCDTSRLAGNSPHPAYCPGRPPLDSQRYPRARQCAHNPVGSLSRSDAPTPLFPHHQHRLVRLRRRPHPLWIRVSHLPFCV